MEIKYITLLKRDQSTKNIFSFLLKHCNGPFEVKHNNNSLAVILYDKEDRNKLAKKFLPKELSRRLK